MKTLSVYASYQGLIFQKPGGKQDHPLTPGDLLLLEAGDTHEIACTGDSPLETFNIYAPTAY